MARDFKRCGNPQAQNREHAEALRKKGIEIVELDVSNDTSVEHAVKEVLDRARRLDV